MDVTAVLGSQLKYCVEVATELLADVEEQTVCFVHQAQRLGRESPSTLPPRAVQPPVPHGERVFLVRLTKSRLRFSGAVRFSLEKNELAPVFPLIHMHETQRAALHALSPNKRRLRRSTAGESGLRSSTPLQSLVSVLPPKAGVSRHFSPNPTAFRRKALSEQLLAIISASASDNRSSERLSLIDRWTVEASAKGNYRPLAASPSPSCSRRLSGSARSVSIPSYNGNQSPSSCQGYGPGLSSPPE